MFLNSSDGAAGESLPFFPTYESDDFIPVGRALRASQISLSYRACRFDDYCFLVGEELQSLVVGRARCKGERPIGIHHRVVVGRQKIATQEVITIAEGTSSNRNRNNWKSCSLKAQSQALTPSNLSCWVVKPRPSRVGARSDVDGGTVGSGCARSLSSLQAGIVPGRYRPRPRYCAPETRPCGLENPSRLSLQWPKRLR